MSPIGDKIFTIPLMGDEHEKLLFTLNKIYRFIYKYFSRRGQQTVTFLFVWISNNKKIQI